MSDRPRLPALARWAAVALVAPVPVVLTFASVFEFASRCPSGGGDQVDPDTLQGQLCAQAAGDTNPGDIVITVVSALVGAFLIALLLRARRWLSLALIGLLCLATPVAALATVLSTHPGCTVAHHPVGDDCTPSAEE